MKPGKFVKRTLSNTVWMIVKELHRNDQRTFVLRAVVSPSTRIEVGEDMLEKYEAISESETIRVISGFLQELERNEPYGVH